MIGLTVLALLFGYFSLVKRLSKYLSELMGFDDSVGKVHALFVVLLLIPFVDEIVGRIQFHYECKKGGGYAFSEAIKTARAVSDANELTNKQIVPALIPIRKTTDHYVDVDTRVVVVTDTHFSTYGGWVMRAGLNLGNSSSCGSDLSLAQLMAARGFENPKSDFFERASGR